MSTNIPPDYNPYAGPAVAEDSPSLGGPERAPGEAVKWVYLVTAAISASIYLAITFWEAIGLDWSTANTISGFDAPLQWVRFVLACVWIHAAWSGIPTWWRAGITPGGAVGRLFIPLYNVYWIFDVNARICRETNRTLSMANQPMRAPVQLAYVALVLHIAGNVMSRWDETKTLALFMTILDMGLWFLYMAKCDAARRLAVRFQRDEDQAP